MWLCAGSAFSAGWGSAWDNTEYRGAYPNYSTKYPGITEFYTKEVMAVDSFDAIKERDALLCCVIPIGSWDNRPSVGVVSGNYGDPYYDKLFYRYEFMNYYRVRKWIQQYCSNFVDQAADQDTWYRSHRSFKHYTQETLLEQADPDWENEYANAAQFYDPFYFRGLVQNPHRWPVIKSMMALLIEADVAVSVCAKNKVNMKAPYWDSFQTYTNGGHPTDPPTLINTCTDFALDGYCDCVIFGSTYSGPYGAFAAIGAGPLKYSRVVYQAYPDAEWLHQEGGELYALTSLHYAEFSCITNLAGTIRTAHVNQEWQNPDWIPYTHVVGGTTVVGVYPTHTNTWFYVQPSSNATPFVMAPAGAAFSCVATNFGWITPLITEVDHTVSDSTEGSWPYASTYGISYYYAPYHLYDESAYVLIKPTLEYK